VEEDTREFADTADPPAAGFVEVYCSEAAAVEEVGCIMDHCNSAAVHMYLAA